MLYDSLWQLKADSTPEFPFCQEAREVKKERTTGPIAGAALFIIVLLVRSFVRSMATALR